MHTELTLKVQAISERRHSISQGGMAGFEEMLGNIFSCERNKNRMAENLMEARKMRFWWPEFRGGVAPATAVNPWLGKAAAFRQSALKAYFYEKGLEA